MHAFSNKHFSLVYLPLAASLKARTEARKYMTEVISMKKNKIQAIAIQAIS